MKEQEKLRFISLFNKNTDIFDYPADFGGLGEIFNINKLENINFFDYKPSKKKPLPTLEIKQGIIHVNLESNHNNSMQVNSDSKTIKGNVFPMRNPLMPQFPIDPRMFAMFTAAMAAKQGMN